MHCGERECGTGEYLSPRVQQALKPGESLELPLGTPDSDERYYVVQCPVKRLRQLEAAALGAARCALFGSLWGKGVVRGRDFPGCSCPRCVFAKPAARLFFVLQRLVSSSSTPAKSTSRT